MSSSASRATGASRKVITRGGLELAADAVVIGAGVTPDVQLAQRAGLEIGERGGVRCSSRLESSAPGVFAAGDICEYESRRARRRTCASSTGTSPSTTARPPR